MYDIRASMPAKQKFGKMTQMNNSCLNVFPHYILSLKITTPINFMYAFELCLDLKALFAKLFKTALCDNCRLRASIFFSVLETI